MKRVKLLKAWVSHQRGSVIEVEVNLAARLVRDGFAEYVPDAPRPSESKIRKPETRKG